MNSPVILIALYLGTAFFTAAAAKKHVKISYWIAFVSFASAAILSGLWIFNILYLGEDAIIQSSAGFSAPFSIALKVGFEEAGALFLINLIGFLGLPFVHRFILKNGRLATVTYILYFMALNGIVMTRDIFNYFVFIEISSVAVAGMLLFNSSKKTLKAGFSWLIATGIISLFLILGAILIYINTGVLDIDSISHLSGNMGLLGGFFLFLALVLELKPFPANGWALDVYESAPAGISAVISGAGLTAGLFALYKFLPVAGPFWYIPAAGAGLITFVAAGLSALRQDKVNRMLGYSSIAQTGLAVAVIGLKDIFGDQTFFIASSIVIVHALAKAGLFWISSTVGIEKIKDWAALKNKPIFVFLMAVFIFSMLAFPPFPTFFAKWTMIERLAATSNYLWMGLILLGSLLEAAYLIRWFGYVLKGETKVEATCPMPTQAFPMIIPALGLLAISYFIPVANGFNSTVTNMMPFLAVIIIALLFDFLPAKLKNALLITTLGYQFYVLYPQLTEFRTVFAIVFLVGGLIVAIAGFNSKGKRIGFYPAALMMYAGLTGLLVAETTMDFFFSWELMTMGSYFLILRGKKSMPHALSYMLFSLGGAYSILAGFGLLSAANMGNLALDSLSTAGPHHALIFILLVIGFLTKTASLPFHIWLPGAHSEAETDVSPVVSAILLKAGIFGLIIIMLKMGPQSIGGVDLYYLIGWLGAITALIGNIMAAFEEDAKRLLAYSSVGQLGYVVFALGMMNHIGWLAAVAFALNHFVFKALLFLAVGGVVSRVKTRNMYEMGGLIKNMPFSFISVLIGIIALSGVPPLTGFAGKWLSYNAIILSGWYLPGVVVTFAGLVAFLYCFRLIHTIFLGQMKDTNRKVKEAPFWYLIPQYLLIGAVMYFSIVPNAVLKPIGSFLTKYFPENILTWNGSFAQSSLGHWDGGMIMYVTGTIFVLVFIWLLIINRKAVKIKQFNIVFAAERPARPELTHFAYNFFAPYKKALGFLVTPIATAFWGGVAEFANSTGAFFIRLFSGTPQTYAIHILLFSAACYLFIIGG